MTCAEITTNKKHAWKVLLLGSFSGIFLLTIGSTALAASSSTFSVSPTKLEMNVKPGDTGSAPISVLNRSDHPISVKIYLNDFVVLPDNTFVYEAPGRLPNSAAKWVTLSETEFSIPPGESHNVNVTLTVPQNTNPASYEVAVLVELQYSGPASGPRVAITGRIASLILATSGPPISLIRKGAVTDFAAFSGFGTRLFGWAAPNPRFRTVFHNSGNVYLHLKGHVLVRDIFGRQVASIDMPDITTYPDNDRETWTVWGNPPLFGFYTAEATMVSSHYEYTKTEHKKATFFSVNLIALGILLATAIVLTAIGIWRWRQHRR